MRKSSLWSLALAIAMGGSTIAALPASAQDESPITSVTTDGLTVFFTEDSTATPEEIEFAQNATHEGVDNDARFANLGTPGQVTASYGAGTPGNVISIMDDAIAAWGDLIDVPANAPIHVSVNWTDLGNTGILGSAGAASNHRGGSLPIELWTPAPLANALTDSDVNGTGTPEINVNFNSTFASWHIATSIPPSNLYDLLTVAMHELGHGFGFAGSLRDTGWSSSNRYRFDDHVYYNTVTKITTVADPLTPVDLVTSGDLQIDVGAGRMFELYAPSPFQSGSSYSHFDEATYGPGSALALMTPSVSNGEVNRDVFSPVIGLMEQMGYPLLVTPATPVADTLAPAETEVAVTWTESLFLTATPAWEYIVAAGGQSVTVPWTQLNATLTGLTADTTYDLTITPVGKDSTTGTALTQSFTTNAAVADTEDPVVDVVTPATGSTEAGPDITVTGTSSDNVDVVQVRGYLRNSTTGEYWNGTAWVASWAWFIVPTDVNGDWTYTAAGASDGSYSAIAWSWDAAGNRSTADTNTFLLGAEDTEDPVVDVVTPATGSTEPGPDLIVAGTSGDNVDVVQVRGYLRNSTSGDYWNGTAWVASWAWFIVPTDANGDWTYTATGAADGNHQAIAWAWDAAGNRSTPDTNTFFAQVSPPDTEDPTVDVVTPAIGSTEAGPDVAVAGTSGDNVDVVQVRGYLRNTTTGDYWNGTAWVTSWAWFVVPTDPAGDWSYTAAGAADGNYSAIAWSWDAAGNRSTPDTNTFSVGAQDTELPVVDVVTPAPGSFLLDPFVDVTGTSSDNVDVVQVRGYLRNTTTDQYWNGTAWVATWAWFVVPTDANGDWTYTANGAVDGDYTAIAWSWDAAGNRSVADTNTFVVIIEPEL